MENLNEKLWYINNGTVKEGSVDDLYSEEFENYFFNEEDACNYARHLNAITKEFEDINPEAFKYAKEISSVINDALKTHTLYIKFKCLDKDFHTEEKYRRMYKGDLHRFLASENKGEHHSKLVYILNNIYTEDCMSYMSKYCNHTIWNDIKSNLRCLFRNIYPDVVKKYENDLVGDLKFSSLKEFEDYVISKLDANGKLIDWEKFLERLE